MGLFKKRKSRATRKAEAKALKHKAKVEAKLAARNDRKRTRSERRAAAKLDKAQLSTLKAQEKAALKVAAKAERDPFSVASVKKYLGVARVLAPVLAPLAYKGATFVRGRLDSRRASQLGVGVQQLGEYTGHGAKLTARIASAESSTNDILERNGTDGKVKKFAESTRTRLSELSMAVRTAEQMPPERRRAAHQAIAEELGRIETELLDKLGVH